MDVEEGATRFRAPTAAPTKGPKAKEGVPFYNPAMRLSRDLSVLVLARARAEAGRDLSVCDAMASLGARGLRLAHEVPGVHVLLNDANPDSIQLAKQNADRLGLRNVDFRLGRLEPLLADDQWDWVDIDPFGTPAPHIDPAIGAVRAGGILAVTATDKAALCGVYPDVCLRRYNAHPLHGPVMWEVATRILVGALSRAAGRRDRSIEPVLAHSTNHYVRVYVRVHDGAPANGALAPDDAYAWVAPDLSRGLAPAPPAGTTWGGPLWSGSLGQASFLGELQSPSRPLERLLRLVREETGAAPLYYTIDELTRNLKVNAPRLAKILERLRAMGFAAVRTHFTPRGIKTTAPVAALQQAVRA